MTHHSPTLIHRLYTFLFSCSHNPYSLEFYDALIKHEAWLADKKVPSTYSVPKKEYLLRIRLCVQLFQSLWSKQRKSIEKGSVVGFPFLHLYICNFLRNEMYKNDEKKGQISLAFLNPSDEQNPYDEEFKRDIFFLHCTAQMQDVVEKETFSITPLGQTVEHGEEHVSDEHVFKLTIHFTDTVQGGSQLKNLLRRRLRRQGWNPENQRMVFSKRSSVFEFCQVVYTLMWKAGCNQNFGARINNIRAEVIESTCESLSGQKFFFVAPNCAQRIVSHLLSAKESSTRKSH
eukprot:CAMPEP_0117448946 /NCGR_PEP_ID=MMETSP0759-20121206/7674_1 /TAXON_ID=63605 /ORGANISM="Percolomonas cosmopolitus, Strain WS" /LENGTH=287 /DNA_ID=CAMNT_0005241371 /DNA_START=5 /DNA_END=868 /DNA_ORIENTATION=+